MIDKPNLSVITFALCQALLVYETDKTECAKNALIETLQQRVMLDSLEIRIIDLIAKALIESGIHMADIRLRDIDSLKEKGGGALIYAISENNKIVAAKFINNYEVFNLLNDFIDSF